jgi:hypothetical protein
MEQQSEWYLLCAISLLLTHTGNYRDGSSKGRRKLEKAMEIDGPAKSKIIFMASFAGVLACTKSTYSKRGPV